MNKLLVIALSVAGAGVGVMLATRYLLKGADGSGYIEIKDGLGADDFAQGAGALAGAWVGHKVASMLFKGKG